MFQTELEEVKTEILDTLEQLHEEQAKASQKGLQSPEDYLDAINAAPTILNCFLSDLAVQMGRWFTMIAGGPDPADGGNICTRSFHVGINGHKRNFQDKYAHHSVNPKDTTTWCMTFEEGVITPYGQFLKTLFSPEADIEVLNVMLNDDEDNEREAMLMPTPGMSGLLSKPHTPLSPPPPSFQPASTPTPSTPDVAPISPSIPLFQPPSMTLVSASLVAPPIPSFQLDLMLQPSESCEELGREDLDPQLFWQDTSFGHNYFLMGATEHDRLVYNNLLGHAVLDHEDEGESFPFISGTMSGEGPVDLRIPGKDYPYLQPEPEGSQLPLLPSHDQDHTDVHEMDVDLPSPSSVPRIPFLTQFDGELTPEEELVMVIDGSKGWQEVSATVVDGNEGQQEESTTVDEDAGEEHERRMSKHAWKLPASHAVVAVSWLPSEVKYLTDGNLGPEWADLLADWQVLEVQISQNGSPTKGQLGTITSRPLSLSVWLQNCCYNVHLQLLPLFSVEFLAWWNTLQPNWQ
ncbi:hypothetical protein EDD18DRAFT_1355855 [Armillaria luteobubalina]|uniref:Uncharacterized protein n=1 Tax=Armillaria luteobubalina TaxID=153913 RepID=A0AA39Q1I6_9AGAR|nr:hypothetical protein EDD18DRAFT_1355855 [Armillaria luteobubalina]